MTETKMEWLRGFYIQWLSFTYTLMELTWFS